MKLNEILKICLLALASRCPGSVVEINEDVLGHPMFWVETIHPLEALELLRSHAPALLQAPARIVIDAQESVIYLIDRSEEMPAFWIYCGGYSSKKHSVF